jgi:Tfp pilus assembly protein PilX
MRTLRRHSLHAQRGYSLIIAVAIIALLSLVGLMVLDQAANDVQLAGADRAAQNALYVADAGAVWAKQYVIDTLYPPGTATGAPPTATNLDALPALAQNDVLCPENTCSSPPCPTSTDCSRFHLITSPAWVPYGAGQYRAAASCEPSCTVASPLSYTLRAMGQTPDGATRLIEMTLGQ